MAVRSYGDIWNQSLLVEVDSTQLDELSKSLARAESAHRSNETRQLIIAAGLVASLAVLIYVAYLLLNAATKGYYTLLLRIGAVLVIVGGALLVLVLG